MRIAITGVPCTGKTTIAKALAKALKLKYISLNDLARKAKAFVGYDKALKARIVDVDKIKKLVKKLEGNYILDGHYSHEFDVDLIIVLRCRPDILESRLKKRYPNNMIKVKENVDAEILGVITSEVLQSGKRFFEIDVSNKSLKEILDEIKKRLKDGEKSKLIDWIEFGYEVKV